MRTVAVITTKRHFCGAGKRFDMQPNEADIYKRRGMVEYLTENAAPAESVGSRAVGYLTAPLQARRGPGRPKKSAA